MFIRKSKTDKGIFYTLTIINANDDNKKTKFITFFIPEQLATHLVSLGVTLKEKGDE